MFFSSIKEINRSISKGMSNIYLKVTIEKKVTYSKLPFSKFKRFVSKLITEYSNFLLQLKNQKPGSKTVCGFSVMTFYSQRVQQKRDEVENVKSHTNF